MCAELWGEIHTDQGSAMSITWLIQSAFMAWSILLLHQEISPSDLLEAALLVYMNSMFMGWMIGSVYVHVCFWFFFDISMCVFMPLYDSSILKTIS